MADKPLTNEYLSKKFKDMSLFELVNLAILHAKEVISEEHVVEDVPKNKANQILNDISKFSREELLAILESETINNKQTPSPIVDVNSLVDHKPEKIAR